MWTQNYCKSNWNLKSSQINICLGPVIRGKKNKDYYLENVWAEIIFLASWQTCLLSLCREEHKCNLFFPLHLRPIWSSAYMFSSNILHLTPFLTCKSTLHPDLLYKENLYTYWILFFSFFPLILVLHSSHICLVFGFFLPNHWWAMNGDEVYIILSHLFSHHSLLVLLCNVFSVLFEGLCYHTMSAFLYPLPDWDCPFWKQEAPKKRHKVVTVEGWAARERMSFKSCWRITEDQALFFFLSNWVFGLVAQFQVNWAKLSL